MPAVALRSRGATKKWMGNRTGVRRPTYRDRLDTVAHPGSSPCPPLQQAHVAGITGISRVDGLSGPQVIVALPGVLGS